MIPIRKQPLIHRTQDQLLSRGFTNISLICSTTRLESYIANSNTKHIEPAERGTDIRYNSVVWSYQDHISITGTTVFLFGDTYYSDEFMDDLTNNVDKGLLIYDRIKRQYLYQSPESEHFVIIFNKLESSIYLDCMNEISTLYSQLVQEKKTTAAGLASYVHARLYSFREKKGIPNPLSYRKYWSDLTDDFDYPYDWDLKHKYFPDIFTKPNES
jgi:hypothetical protein